MPTVHAALPSLSPLLPELILGIGVLLLILYGAWRGERSAESVSVGALVLLSWPCSRCCRSRPRPITTLSGAFRVGPVLKGDEVAGAARLGGGDPAFARLLQA